MKIQRNTPCPCKSGKKYKKCCWLTEDLTVRKVILPNGHFIMELRPEAEEECNHALDQLGVGNLAYAKGVGERLYELYPHDYSVNFLQGCCSISENRNDEAILYFEKVTQIWPYCSEAYFNLASLYLKKIKIEKAVDCLRKVIEIDGQHEELGKKAQEELAKLEQVTQKNSKCSLDEYIRGNRFFDRAFACINEGKYEMAIVLFHKVLAIDSEHTQSYGNMALAHSFLGQNKLALECIDKALAIDSDYLPAVYNRKYILQLNEGERLTMPINIMTPIN